MSAHPPEHEELLEQILSGALAEGDARARAQLEACAECRSELERLRTLDAGLRGAVRQERTDLERARADASPAEEELVRRSLAAALPARVPRLRASLVFAALAAASVLVLALLVYERSRDSRGTPEILLHGGTIQCSGAVGVVDDYDEFTWNASLPPSGRFSLRIHAARGQEKGDLLRTIVCKEPQWIPTPAEKRALPDEIYWEVDALDASEVSVGHGWATAERRSPSH